MEPRGPSPLSVYMTPWPSMNSTSPPLAALRRATDSGQPLDLERAGLHADELVAVAEPVLRADVLGDLLGRGDVVVRRRLPGSTSRRARSSPTTTTTTMTPGGDRRQRRRR